MAHFLVMWEIDAFGDTPEEAARYALMVQRRQGSIATVFEVVDDGGEKVQVDLTKIDESRASAVEPVSEKRIKIICRHCGSDEVMRDAWAAWDVDTQQWVLHGDPFDHARCDACGGESSLKEIEVDRDGNELAIAVEA